MPPVSADNPLYFITAVTHRRLPVFRQERMKLSARRVIGYLKENQFEASLNKLRKEQPGRKDYRYSLWEHHSNTFLITTESMLLKKVNYIHLNPVEDGLIEDLNEYVFSSVRFWNRRPILDGEPLGPDLKDLTWKNGGRASF